jgi:hypothetical protein
VNVLYARGSKKYRLDIDKIPMSSSRNPKTTNGFLSLSTNLFIKILPVATPVKKTANIPEKAYVEVSKNRISWRDHIIS